MNVSKEELLHIANLACLEIDENEVDNYIENLQEILNFAETLNKAPVDVYSDGDIVNEKYNVFRKDEVIDFENNVGLLANAPDKDRNMFKIPKVYNSEN